MLQNWGRLTELQPLSATEVPVPTVVISRGLSLFEVTIKNAAKGSDRQQ